MMTEVYGAISVSVAWRCGATSRMAEVWCYHSYGGGVALPFVWWRCGATSRMMEVWCYQSYDRGVVLSVV